MTHTGKFLLSPAKDLPLLLLIRDATFISRQQIELLIAGRTNELNYHNRNRRLARLAELDQIQIYPQCFPYPGRIFAVTQQGMNTLQVAGLGILSASADTETLADGGQVPHFIGLNEIEIAARKAFGVRQWIGDRQLKSLNIASNRPTEKDYDSIAEVTSPADSNAVIHIGIEYERTIKSKDRYAQIRQILDSERQIQGLIYFVDNETNALFVSREVYSATVPVGVVIVSQFQSKGPHAALRVVQDRSVVRVSIQDFVASIGCLTLQ
jgi:hypothetical protein